MKRVHAQQTHKQGALHPKWFRVMAMATMVVFLQVGVVPISWAQPEDLHEQTEGTGAQYGFGAASVLLSIPYGLGKFVFATLGGLFGGFTYAFSGGNSKAAKSVWDTSMRGTYVITPEHLRGERTVRFLGVPADGVDESEPQSAPIEPLDLEPGPRTDEPPPAFEPMK